MAKLSQVARRIRPAVFASLQASIDRRGAELIPLHIGDTHLPPPESARLALRKLDPDDAGLHRYGPTGGLPELREAMARVFAGRGLDIDPVSEVLVGNGGTHALYAAARTVLDAGDEVIMAAPYWPLAPGVFTACDAIPVDADFSQRLYTDPTLDPAALLGTAISPRTRALYFISPNNPDGKVLSLPQLERVAAFARDHDLWVFADEVYADIVYGEPVPSIATLPGMRERTIVLHSLSKSHALAGLRIGFVTAPEAVVAAGRRVSTHTLFNVSVAMQRMAIAALSDTAFPATARDVYRTARDAAVAALAGAPVDVHVPEGATYLFLDFAPALRRREGGLYRLLADAVDHGVLLAPGDACGASFGDSFARLCFTAVPLPRVLLGIHRLRAALDS